MDVIRSKEYFDAVKTYSDDNRNPARVYKFLMETLQEGKHLPYEEMLYRHIDIFEATEDYVCFLTDKECTLVLYPS